MPDSTNVLSVFVGDLRTGKVLTRLSPVSGSWQQAPISSAGNLSVTLNAADLDAARVDLFHNTAVARSFLAFAYDGIILNAGPIWTRRYNRSSGQLALGAAGVWSLFDHRKVMPLLYQPFPVSPPGNPGTVQSGAGDTYYDTASNLSLADIAKRLVQQAMAHMAGNLPIQFLPDQGLNPGATRTYHGYELKWLGQMLQELSNVQTGPDIRLVPSFTDSTRTAIQWTMLAGTPTIPQLSQGGADWFFDTTTVASPVADVEYDEDGSAMTTRAWGTGAGAQSGLLMSQTDSTTLTAAGYPLLESDQAFSNVIDQATLDGHTQAMITSNGRPSALWKLTIRDDGGQADSPRNVPTAPRLGLASPGDYCQIITGKDDPFLPAGQRRARIAMVEGDLSFNYTLTCFSTQAEV